MAKKNDNFIMLPTALRQEYPDEKLGILDVRALMEDGAQVNMEMQAYPFGQWDARSLFYLSKMYTDQIGRGDPYTKLKKCIHVSILDFIRFADDEKCHRIISLCDEQTGKKYTDLLEMQILELKKLPEELQSDDEVIRWMRFLAGKNRKELEDMASTSEYIEEAYRELERMSADERARLEYEARQKAIRDHDAIMNSAWETGLEKGLQEGREKGLQEGREKGLQEERNRGGNFSEQITAGNFCGSDGICFCSYGNVQTVFPPLCVSCSGTPYDPGVPEKGTFCSVGNGKRKENS